jgi:predicted acylesterase/phospholipase RssA
MSNTLLARGYQGIALSGCGWLLPFHIGCYETLIHNNTCPDDIPLAGASGGALVAAGIASGIQGLLISYP